MSGAGSILMTAAAFAPPASAQVQASMACSIYAGGRTVVVMGVAPGTTARLCMSTSMNHQCSTPTADRGGVIVARSAEDLTGPIWAEPSSLGGRAVPSCGAVVAAPSNESRPLVIALLSALGAFLTGLAVTLIPRALERRRRSSEAATAWVGEYLTRLSNFARSGEADAEPRPQPVLIKRDATRLSAITMLAGNILDEAGYLGATSEADRHHLIAPVVAALRSYPSEPPAPVGGS
ncbi:MAG: hypothetical protein PGN23_07270 [Sphingomonas adhaesiva]|uniref:hypothetical protein n=1 Tax=Sphingomonas adhaesiva TaxID=28212 RepID=UPI002FF748A1